MTSSFFKEDWTLSGEDWMTSSLLSGEGWITSSFSGKG